MTGVCFTLQMCQKKLMFSVKNGQRALDGGLKFLPLTIRTKKKKKKLLIKKMKSNLNLVEMFGTLNLKHNFLLWL